MGFARLAIDVSCIYAAFLSWALVQERLSSTPYDDPAGGPPRYFRSILFLNTVQSAVAAVAALLYLVARWRRGQTFGELIGLGAPPSANGTTGKHARKLSDTGFHSPTVPRRSSAVALLARVLQCAVCQSIASPLTFASLRHIDYPTMILGKSCKLIPVMLMNVVLYRRSFPLHKYMVVAMVTFGISVFTLFAPVSAHKKGGAQSSSLLGLGLLLGSLAVDGATNSTQDEVFARYRISGSQMMLFMNAFATLLTSFVLIFPLPHLPFPGIAGTNGVSELSIALEFVRAHPGVWRDILLYGVAGALGQLFIFDTLEHFGSLTLVTITVTRKLFTMLLSVAVYKHRLAPLQWVGVALVFAGIGLEAQVKRRGGLRKQIVTDEAQKARLKAI